MISSCPSSISLKDKKSQNCMCVFFLNRQKYRSKKCTYCRKVGRWSGCGIVENCGQQQVNPHFWRKSGEIEVYHRLIRKTLPPSTGTQIGSN